MKVHIGSGAVYLNGWLNVDVEAPSTFLAADRPDLVERWITNEDTYYARHMAQTLDSMRSGAIPQEYVCDAFGSFWNLPEVAHGSEEVLARQSFEHLSIREAHEALSYLYETMATGGILRLDVPDHEATLWQFRLTGDPFFVRHLLGPRLTDYGYHMMSYTRIGLETLVESHGFRFVEQEPNIHFYPAFCLRFRK